MDKINITKDKLLLLYINKVDEISDFCDWKTSFSGEEVCSIVVDILKANDSSITLTNFDLHRLYSKKIKSLNLSDEEWCNKYGIPEIINLIYEILTDGN